MKLERDILIKIAEILDIHIDFTEECDGEDSPRDKLWFLYFLKEDFLESRNCKAKDIIKLVRFLDAKGIKTEDFPLIKRSKQ